MVSLGHKQLNIRNLMIQLTQYSLEDYLGRERLKCSSKNTRRLLEKESLESEKYWLINNIQYLYMNFLFALCYSYNTTR